MPRELLPVVVILLESLLALTAAAGGIGLLTGMNAPVSEWQSGSPFNDYTIPGLSLRIGVGGSAMSAAVMMSRRHRLAAHASVVAGAMPIGCEIMELTDHGLHAHSVGGGGSCPAAHRGGARLRGRPAVRPAR